MELMEISSYLLVSDSQHSISSNSIIFTLFQLITSILIKLKTSQQITTVSKPLFTKSQQKKERELQSLVSYFTVKGIQYATLYTVHTLSKNNGDANGFQLIDFTNLKYIL